MPICKLDLSVGGAYRYVWRKEGVSDMGLGGVFQEIVSPERILVPGRRSGHHRIRRDRPRHQHDGCRTLRIAGSARHRPPVRHGARDGGRLQPTGGNAFVDARRWRAMKTPPESKSTNVDEFMRQLQHPPHLEIEAVRHLIRDAQSVGQHLQDRADYRQGEGAHNLDAFNMLNQPGIGTPSTEGIISLRNSAQGARVMQFTLRLTWWGKSRSVIDPNDGPPPAGPRRVAGCSPTDRPSPRLQSYGRRRPW